MASGWNLWVWLECISVVSGCCCKEVYRYPHNNYYFSLLHLYYSAADKVKNWGDCAFYDKSMKFGTQLGHAI